MVRAGDQESEHGGHAEARNFHHRLKFRSRVRNKRRRFFKPFSKKKIPQHFCQKKDPNSSPNVPESRDSYLKTSGGIADSPDASRTHARPDENNRFPPTKRAESCDPQLRK
jgi:hypothetical protein